VEAALEDAASESGLGHESILCVRRLALPFRRSPPVSGALRAEASGAARPAGGPVPAGANAVLFADRAELLACLARDWCAGNAGGAWWWTVLFPRNDLGAIVRRVWLNDARPLPAAFARLEAAGLASPFLAKFSPVDLRALWQNFVQTFQLQDLAAAWSETGHGKANPAATRRSLDAAPWSAWITPPVSLGMDAARVLITAILLERVPAKIRSRSFAREIRAWIQQSTITDHVSGPPSNEPFPFVEEGSRKSELAPVAGLPADLPSALDQEPILDGERVEPVNRLGRERIALPGASNRNSITTARSPNAAARKERSTDDHPEPPRTQKHSPKIDEQKSKVAPVRFEEARSAPSIPAAVDECIALPAAAAPDCISTAWGGSLYLVNVAIALGYYGDFASPARTGLALSLWDFLALLAGRMIGDEFAEDPLSRLFARLSGRAEEEPPAAQFEPPAGEPPAIWLERICHGMQARVLASLGLGDDCDLRDLVLNQQAKIETSPARLDAHFSLADHPIELRLAGLDRDPGWVPAGGRSIYFHYE